MILIFVFTLLSKNLKKLLDRFKTHRLGEIGISSITSAELHYGVSKSANFNKNQIALNQFLIPLEIFDFDYNALVEHGKIRYELEKVGTPIGPLDLLIAAHAKSLVMTLVTNNEKEFNRVSGLKIENWIKE